MTALSLPAMPGRPNPLEARREEYNARKQREEREKGALLPPGLVNQGNTCFMNTILQSLLATRLLSDVVHFLPILPLTQQFSNIIISSRRSPLLTNGHGLGGKDEQPWVDKMPLGDEFLDFMVKAWNMQSLSQRGSMNPKPLLLAISQKHEEYRYLAQQDAHEFLRHLLDGMRMEEHDIIKVRQPPQEQTKKRRRTTITPTNNPGSPPYITMKSLDDPLPAPLEEEKLLSLADMIFGGELTSILVCQKCKHVSQTYEDFNDISLSIKPEDYHHGKKRELFKNFAKRLNVFPAHSLNPGNSIQRPSSVPPSPSQPDRQLGDHPEEESKDKRRRSLDNAAEEGDGGDSGHSTSKEDNLTTESDGSNVVVKTDMRHVEFVEGAKREIDKEKEKKEKKSKKDASDDAWSKLGRRISMSVGLTKGKERKGRSRERNSMSSTVVDAVANESTKTVLDNTIPGISTPRSSTAQSINDAPPEIHLTPPPSSSRASSPKPTDPRRDSSPEPSSRFPKVQRGKSPKPPKLSPAEEEYLRKILADVGSPGASTSFSNLFKAPSLPTSNRDKRRSLSTGTHSGKHNLFLGGQLSIEECLRMFTSVEVLDGENMVGCRRCWKIANGQYSAQREGAGEESPDEPMEGSSSPSPEEEILQPQKKPDEVSSSLSLGVQIPTSLSTPTVSFYSRDDTDTADERSVSSLPTEITLGLNSGVNSEIDLDVVEPVFSPLPEVLTSGQMTPGGLPIPSISTTAPDAHDEESALSDSDPEAEITLKGSAPDSPAKHSELANGITNIAAPTPRIAPRLGEIMYQISGESRDSLNIPSSSRHRRQDTADADDDSSGGESETSISGESIVSNHIQPTSTSTLPKLQAQAPKKPSRPKPVIMRPAYKRYLINTPPPVLVIHLKRFHHLAKAPVLSWQSTLARKLEEYVSFPEYLDLTPFLAPKKEEYGLGSRTKVKSYLERRKEKEKQKCMYRLYAVVRHMGNMTSGHYVTYVALPGQPPAGPSPGDIPAPEACARSDTIATASSVASVAPSRQWAYISDQSVHLVSLDEVLNTQAYICMYERC